MQDEMPGKPSIDDTLRAFAAENLGWKPNNMFDMAETPFDISRPNIHDNKREFLLEYDAVKGIVENLDAIYDLLIGPPETDSPERTEMLERLRQDIDNKGFRKKQTKIVDTSLALTLQNVRDSGFFLASLYVIMDMKTIYAQRLLELEDQEEQFWNVGNRPPNYYARTIALRFARFYEQQTDTKPTYGTSRDGPHPSTEYGRLLEEVFSILGIDANIRGPAQYAISKIKDEDNREPRLNLIPAEFLTAGIPNEEAMKALRQRALEFHGILKSNSLRR